MNSIYHLTTAPVWNEALQRGEYRADSLATEGFIHASTTSQVEPSANRFFAQEPAIILLVIDPRLLRPEIHWEASSHASTPFPHLYGPINLDAVIETIFWEKSRDDLFHWPPPNGS